MKKPWEETWTAPEEYDSVHIEGNEDRLDMRIGSGDAMGRCRLAAAAPEMARLLRAFIDSDNDLTSSHIDYEDGKLIRAVLSKAGVEVDAS